MRKNDVMRTYSGGLMKSSIGKKSLDKILIWMMINITLIMLALIFSFSINSVLIISIISLLLIRVIFVEGDMAIRTLHILALFLPFYALIRGYLLTTSFYLLTAGINYFRSALILGVFLVLLFRSQFVRDFKVKLRNANHNRLILALYLLACNYLYGFAISLIGGNASIGIKGIHLNLIPIFLVYIIYQSKRIDDDFISNFLRLLTRIGFIVAVIGFYFYLSKPIFFGQIFSAFRMQDESASYIVNYSRMVSTFLSPNVMGSFMAIITIILFNQIMDKFKLKTLIYLIVVMLSLILTMSRGAWGFALVGILASYHLSARRIKLTKKMWGIIVIPVTIVFVFLILDAEMQRIILNRVLTIFDSDSTSSYGRLNDWENALKILDSNISGLGLGVGGINMSLYSNLARDTGIGVIDGFYIKTIIETGIVGIIMFPLFMIISMFSLFNLTSSKNNEHSKYHRITFAVFLGAYVQAFGSNVFDFVQISPLLWLLYGFSLKLTTLTKTDNFTR